MFAVACIGFALVGALLTLGWLRRRSAAIESAEGERRGTFLVVELGIAMPIVVLSALFVWSDIFVIKSTAARL